MTKGCGQPLATIKVGGFLVAAAFNPATGTLYAASPQGDVFVIDAAACSAVTTRGCTQPVRKVKDGLGPAALDIDVATDTVYAVNNGSGNGNTVSVIDGATCNGKNGSGCSQTPHTTTVGSGAFWATVDQASDTVYVANNNDGTVSVINGALCNASVTSGCEHVADGVNRRQSPVRGGPPVLRHGLHGEPRRQHAVGDQCRDLHRATFGCGQRPPNEQASPNQNPGYNPFPNTLALVSQTGTAYVVNVGGTDVLSVLSVNRCNAADTSGCRAEAPSVPAHEYSIATDPATGTSIPVPR